MLRAGEVVLMWRSRLPADSFTNMGLPLMLPLPALTVMTSSVREDCAAQRLVIGAPMRVGTLRSMMLLPMVTALPLKQVIEPDQVAPAWSARFAKKVLERISAVDPVDCTWMAPNCV